MNDLNKILGIYDAKVNVNCVKDILPRVKSLFPQPLC